MTISAFTQEMNILGQARVPFLFMVDFEMEKPVLLKLSDVDPARILFDINGFTNVEKTSKAPGEITVEKFPISRQAYQEKFEKVLSHLEYGDSFLTNLTIKTEIKVDHSLADIFSLSHAKYKLLVEDQFLVFSPEIFVQVKDGHIFSYPMKGTIDASIPNAEKKILSNKKEVSEHITMVDLIRNDLSQVASEVHVTRFRYVEEIRTDSKPLLQVSSEIVGQLEDQYLSRLGDILVRLLPAGSVSGAPKTKTVAIIKSVEEEKRGYYTGVFGVFNGKNLDSGVMIRFIERLDGKYFYRSGGGITTQSTLASEYQEAIDKVYVPVN
jgi:para-aminobenzoate synthetase component I